ncbi:neuropeptides capa receptor-like [Anneissia japonica]|uniref:neuropeptides capa receptor-like n=1 Tax=Anneissia japonica TaxID=1529436 RepID=UPI001425AAD8|nr:neuropeptides capa receptor-like [Anneissia japonica]
MLVNASDGNLTTDYSAYYYTDFDKVAIPIIMPIVVTIGIIGNVMTIIVITSTQVMHTSVNVYFANLAIADTFYLLVAPPWIWNSYIKSPIHNWYDMGEGSNWFCPFYCFITGAATTVALFTILWLSIERYMAVCKLFQFRKSGFGICSRSIKICVIIWLLSLSWMARHLASTSAKIDEVEGLHITKCEPSDLNFKLMFVDLPIIFLATIVMVVLHTAMLITLRKTRVILANSAGTAKKYRLKSEKKIFLTIVVIVTVYFVCILPKYIHVLLLHYTNTSNISPMNIFKLMSIINSSVNPLIYNALNDTFRRAFRDVYCRKCNK